jgi:bifunctional non-homologous end joining protein LigD
LLSKSAAWEDYGEGHRPLEPAIKLLARSMKQAA